MYLKAYSYICYKFFYFLNATAIGYSSFPNKTRDPAGAAPSPRMPSRRERRSNGKTIFTGNDIKPSMLR